MGPERRHEGRRLALPPGQRGATYDPMGRRVPPNGAPDAPQWGATPAAAGVG